MAQHNEYGKWGEELATQYLRNKGYAIRHRNWKSGRRDLDIVAVTPDGQTLAFVEVKTRRNNNFAEPEQAVDWSKIRSLTMAASAYMSRFCLDMELRFDIITVVGEGQETHINHIEGAFLPPQF
ncbi:MAG: YraN family protein [Prevotella sp.]|nr:YraN family protein [Prevotella sp.]